MSDNNGIPGQYSVRYEYRFLEDKSVKICIAEPRLTHNFNYIEFTIDGNGDVSEDIHYYSWLGHDGQHSVFSSKEFFKLGRRATLQEGTSCLNSMQMEQIEGRFESSMRERVKHNDQPRNNTLAIVTTVLTDFNNRFLRIEGLQHVLLNTSEQALLKT